MREFSPYCTRCNTGMKPREIKISGIEEVPAWDCTTCYAQSDSLIMKTVLREHRRRHRLYEEAAKYALREPDRQV